MKFILDENVDSNKCVPQGTYNMGDGTLILSGMGDEAYTVKAQSAVEIEGVRYNAYKAGNRHADVNDFNKLARAPKLGEGTFALFSAEKKGMLTVFYSSSAYIRINRFITEGSDIRTDFEVIANSPAGCDQYSFQVETGYTYLISTTGATNNCMYTGFIYTPDEKINVNVSVCNVDASPEEDFCLSLIDDQLQREVAKLDFSGASMELLNEHTYSINSEDGGIRPLILGLDKIKITADMYGSELKITCHNLEDAYLSGDIIIEDADMVKKLFFINMRNDKKYEAILDADNKYHISLRPGEYRANIETVKAAVTYNRVSAVSGHKIDKNIYTEASVLIKEDIEFRPVLNVPEDYDSLNKAFEAITQMKNRPKDEAGRVTVNLNKDIFEQTVLNADYVTLNGNGHSISWYYGVGILYYSIEASTGLYSERLLKDKYSFEEGNGHLWGGVFIAGGNHFIAENTTFKNTYNYEITKAELDDIAGTLLAVDRRTKGADVTSRAYKERSNAFYIDADCITIKNCKILSSQDTFGRNGPEKYGYRVYIKDSVIGGNVDYICGEFAAVFDNCELQWKTHGDSAVDNAHLGYIVAPKTSPYVFINCRVTTDGQEKTPVKGLWGRTWSENSYAAFINCETNGLIDKTGWGEMSSGHLKGAKFYETGNTENGVLFISDNSKGDAPKELYIDKAYIQSVFGNWEPL